MATTEGYAGSGLDIFNYLVKYVDGSSDVIIESDNITTAYLFKNPNNNNTIIESKLYQYFNNTTDIILENRTRTGELRSAIHLSSRLINGFLEGTLSFTETHQIIDYNIIKNDNLKLLYGKMTYEHDTSDVVIQNKLYQFFDISSELEFTFELIPILESDIFFTYSTGTVLINNIKNDKIDFEYYMIPAETELLKIWMIEHLAPWLDVSMVEYVDLFTPINFKCTIHENTNVDLLPLELLDTITGCYICDHRLALQNAQSLNKVRYHNRDWYHNKRCNNRRRP